MTVVEIFIAYSHNDLRHKDELKKFLRPLLNTGRARVWDDYDIEAGKDWEAEIKKRLYGADIILLLVSPDSLASEYFYGNEVTVSLDRHAKGEAAVIPIILRPCAWQLTPLGNLEALPEKGRPVTKHELQDEAFTHIAHELDDVIRKISNHRLQASERENQYRSFEAVAHTAEHLFHKGEWATARTSYLEAIQLHQPGFSPGIDAMRQRIAECEKQEPQLQARQAFEQRLAEFTERVRHAERLYKNENWREAGTEYGELIKSHEPGFPGDPSEYRRRQLECEQGVVEQERLAREARERQSSYQKQLADGHRLMRNRAYHKALQAAQTALTIKPDDPEALRMIAEARAGIVRLPEELRAARKRMVIIGSIILVVCCTATVLILKWKQHRDTVLAQIAFDLASADKTIPSWSKFIDKYPESEFVEQARDSIKSLESLKKPLVKNAKNFLEREWFKEAQEALEKAKKVDPSDVEVKRLLDIAKKNQSN